MESIDIYESLLEDFEYGMGPIPCRDVYRKALRDNFAEEEIRLSLLLPPGEPIPLEELEERAIKSELEVTNLKAKVDRLVAEGLISNYKYEGKRVYVHPNVITLLEMQMRKTSTTPLTEASTDVFNAMIDGQTDLPTKTPGYRVIPAVESLYPLTPVGALELGIAIPDTRTALPADIVADLIKSEPYIAVTKCACRTARKNAGKDCGHPIEVCIAFGHFAMAFIESGTGRKIDADEAIRIVKSCSELGMITNTTNVGPGGGIEFVCNCCPCSCSVLNSMKRGFRNYGAPSRYVNKFMTEKCTDCGVCIDDCPLSALHFVDGKVLFSEENCIGCGLCVVRCPTGACLMILREPQPDIPDSTEILYSRLGQEIEETKSHSKNG